MIGIWTLHMVYWHSPFTTWYTDGQGRTYKAHSDFYRDFSARSIGSTVFMESI